MRRPEILIAGTGRCGTTYFANLLTAAGKKITHERLYMHTRGVNLVYWQQFQAVGESSFVIAMKMDHPLTQGAKTIIHIVRNPVDTIRSLLYDPYFLTGIAAEPFLKLIPGRDPLAECFEGGYPWMKEMADDPVGKTARYWIEGNQKIAAKKDESRYVLHRVGVDADFKLLDRLQLPAVNIPSEKPDRWYNPRPKVDLEKFKIEEHSEVKKALQLYADAGWGN
jgi:hypothetical protein